MKIRQGFVSNSSSSSFIVIGDAGLTHKDYCISQPWTNMQKDGECRFGWQTKIYSDVYSRVNFAFIQALSAKNQEWVEQIKQVIRDHTGAKTVEHGFLFDEFGHLADGYIDHQSCATCGANVGMFEDYDTLIRFLFDSGSYIQNGNDN